MPQTQVADRPPSTPLLAAGTERTFVPSIIRDVLSSPGQSLDSATRAFMEPRFGHDFSTVRVHADDKAAASARAVSALAYTVGNHVAFDTGQFRPHVRDGQRLLAHELAHTIQQRGGGMEPGNRARFREDEAHRAANQALHGAAPPMLTHSGVAVACQPAPDVARRVRELDAQILLVTRQLQLPVQPLRGPLLARLNQLQMQRQQLAGVADQGASTDPASATSGSATERVYTEEEIRAGTLAYYESTRQVRLDARRAKDAKLQLEIPNMTVAEIESKWKEEGEEAFVAVASSPDSRLNARQRFRIWLMFWADQYKTARATSEGIQRWARARGTFNPEAYGPEYREAVDVVDTADMMFRTSTYVMELLRTAEQRGRRLTLQEINEMAIELARFNEAMINATGMITPRLSGSGATPSVARRVVKRIASLRKKAPVPAPIPKNPVWVQLENGAIREYPASDVKGGTGIGSGVTTADGRGKVMSIGDPPHSSAVKQPNIQPGGHPAATPFLITPRELDGPIPQAKAASGPKRRLTSQEKQTATDIHEALRDVNRGNASAMNRVTGYRPHEHTTGEFAGWWSVDLLPGNPGAMNQMRLFFRKGKNGLFEAKIRQLH